MRGMNSETIDLIYLDPPFNSNTNYAAPIGSEAAGAAFKDTWGLSDIDLAWCELIQGQRPEIHSLFLAVKQIYGDSMMAYLIYMAPRLMEMRRLLKPTGSIYLHCDPTASHYLKLVMDAIFGKQNFQNEIVWAYKSGGASKKRFSKKHDILFFYSKSKKFIFNPQQEKSYNRDFKPYKFKGVKEYKDDLGWHTMVNMKDIWKIDMVGRTSKERTGYPTQKPLALLKRIIRASSNSGDMVLDPFCGCATTCIAAEDLGSEGQPREWVGIDISSKAAELVQSRMRDQLGILAWKGIYRSDIPERTDLGEIPKYNSPENKQLLYGKQGGYCNGCYTHFGPRHLTIDHIVARSKGGADHISNLQLLCGNCNSIKGNKPHAYLANILKNRGFIDAVTQKLLQERDELEPSKV